MSRSKGATLRLRARTLRFVRLVNPATAERLAGLAAVGIGVGCATQPAWGLTTVGGLVLAFDVLDWVLTWANARPRGTD